MDLTEAIVVLTAINGNLLIMSASFYGHESQRLFQVLKYVFNQWTYKVVLYFCSHIILP